MCLQKCLRKESPRSAALSGRITCRRQTRQKLAERDRSWEKKVNDRRRDILALDKLMAQIELDRRPRPVRSMKEFIGNPIESK